MENKKLNDDILEEVSGGQIDYEQFDPGFLTMDEDNLVRVLMAAYYQKHKTFEEAYNLVYERFFVKFNNDHVTEHIPPVSEAYFRKRLQQHWVNWGGTL